MKLNQIHVGDALELARQLPDNSVHCCITSPPYWGLRDYGTAKWIGGDPGCTHRPTRKNGTETSTLGSTAVTGNDQYEGYKGDTCPKCGATRIDQQMGLEPTIGEHIEKLVTLFRELRRALHPSGTLWLNYGDCYATSANGRSAADTKAAGNDDRTFRDKPFSTANELPAKNLVGMAWRVALALQDDGWILRSDIIWHKVTAMPESVKDRPTRAHEYLFLFSKKPRYFYDQEAIREPLAAATLDRGYTKCKLENGGSEREKSNTNPHVRQGKGWWSNPYIPTGRNRRTVWSIPSASFSEAHFATFPPKLIEPCILAGTSAKGVCPCLNPWRRVIEPTPEYAQHLGDWADYDKDQAEGRGHFETENGYKSNATPTKRGKGLTASYTTVGWEPTCDCYQTPPLPKYPDEKNTPVEIVEKIRKKRLELLDEWRDLPTIPAIALDPFMGSGTVAQVAITHRRDWLGFELNPEYAEMAMRRIASLQVKLF